jgi:hypothetical protein
MKEILLLLFIVNCHCLNEFLVFTVDINIQPCIGTDVICNDTKSCNDAICKLSLSNDDCSRIIVFVPGSTDNSQCCLPPGKQNLQFNGIFVAIDSNKEISKTPIMCCQGVDECVNTGCFFYFKDKQIMWLGFIGLCQTNTT